MRIYTIFTTFAPTINKKQAMKDFWKIVLGAAVGFLLVNIIITILTFMLIGGIAASASALTASSSKTSVPANAVLDIDMSSLVIGEQTLEENPFEGMSYSGMNAEPVRTVGILDATRALEAAADDPSVKLAYIRPDMATGITHLEELRTALEKFRRSGKPVIAYISTPTNAGYYLASVADRIYMSEYHGGMNMLVGISGRLMFLKDLLDKLGVNIQLIRHGKYKSAGEMYIRNSASPENLEQTTVMIKGIWAEMAAPMAQRAGKSIEEFNALIDNLELTDAQAFLDNGLVDELVSYEGMKEKLCTHSGSEDFSSINTISLADYAALKVKKNYKAHEKIAIIYADGEIIDGHGKEQVAGKRFADLVDKVRRDSKVKAVVLRVNSPGGSVIASSQIKDAIDALRAEKPVVASYGSYAASGGYWISSCCDYIFSDATTLTGSIGVFGMLPDFSKTVKDIAHVGITAVPSNKHADMYSFMRPLDAAEVAFVQKDIETIYSQFTSLVASGRKMSVEKVDSLGQGRVWTGRDALQCGLVDRIGNLSDALEYTADLVGCYEYKLCEYPAPLTFMEQFMESFKSDKDEYLVKAFGLLDDLKELKEAKMYARIPYSIEIR